jgi:excisionase family DNA binding protein
MTRRLLTAEELGEVLRVPKATICRLAQTGRIPCVVISEKVRRFDLEAVERALATPPPRRTTNDETVNQ